MALRYSSLRAQVIPASPTAIAVAAAAKVINTRLRRRGVLRLASHSAASTAAGAAVTTTHASGRYMR